MALRTDEIRPTPGPTAQPIGRYQIRRTLAFGGMAEILLAEDLRNQRPVVIKRILPHYASDPEFVQFFIHEGRLGQRLRHPNLVETLEAGRVGETCYIALEYLVGHSCITLLRRAARQQMAIPLGVAVRIITDAARGLHYAHTAVDNHGKPLGVVHRDISPHNLFVCENGVTKVLDFGIAKAASQLHHTRTGTIKGKFAYLSPEQIRGFRVDHRADVFALGIVLYELLTQRPLFRGSNDADTLNRALHAEVPPPESLRPSIPPGLGAVALRALQRDPERRLPSALALAESITAVTKMAGIESDTDDVAGLLKTLAANDHVGKEEGGEMLDGAQTCLLPPSRPSPARARTASPAGARLPRFDGSVLFEDWRWLAAAVVVAIVVALMAHRMTRRPVVEESAVAPTASHEGRLRITVNCPVDVEIDGRPYGTTPLPPLPLDEGGHEVALRQRELGITMSRHVVVTAGRETPLVLSLPGAPRPR